MISVIVLTIKKIKNQAINKPGFLLDLLKKSTTHVRYNLNAIKTFF